MALESMDRGIKVPLIFNLVFSVSLVTLTFIHLVMVTRTLSGADLLVYGGISTLYNILALLTTRHLQWGARSYVREGRRLIGEYRGLTTMSILAFISIPLPIVHLFIKPLDPVWIAALVLDSLATTYFYSFIQILNIVAPRYYSLVFSSNYLFRVAYIAWILYQGGRLAAIDAVLADAVGMGLSTLMMILLVGGAIPLGLLIPRRPDIDSLWRNLRLAVAQYILLPRSNQPSIQYFIAFFLRIGEALVNSLWIVYKILAWGRSFFRGFFAVIYSRQFYGGVDKRVFTEYIDFILYILTPILTSSLYLHRPILSIFRPEYIEYSYLVPLAVLLLILEVVRISLIRLAFGGDRVDIDGFEGVPKGLFYRVSSLELRFFLLFITPAIVGSYILLVVGIPILIPLLLLGILLVQLVLEVILIYRFLSPRLGIGYSSVNPILFLLVSLGVLPLYLYLGTGELVVRDIFIEGPVLLLHLIMGYALYFLLSLSIPWVRRHVRILLGGLMGR